MNDTEQELLTELCTAILNEQDSQKMMQLADELDILLEKKLERIRRNRMAPSESDDMEGRQTCDKASNTEPPHLIK